MAARTAAKAQARELARLRKQVAALEGEAEKLERHLASLDERLADPDVYADGDAVREIEEERVEMREALDTCLREWERASGSLEAAESDPAERLRAIVEGTWALMKRDDFRVMLEIQLQLGRDSDHRARVRGHARQLRAQLRELWLETLPECEPELVERAERLATTHLRGLALERAFGGGRRAHDDERAALVETWTEHYFEQRQQQPALVERLHRCAAFLYDVVCAFALQDLEGLLQRHMRKAAVEFVKGENLVVD